MLKLRLKIEQNKSTTTKKLNFLSVFRYKLNHF
jgi:hypothetical protein